MKASKGYYGYKNYNQWNQSLWINNDEGLYQMAKDYVREASMCDKTKKEAAQYMLDALKECGITHTQDGVKFSKAGILAAMVGM